MRPALILKAPGSHLYPGARAFLEGGQIAGAAVLVSSLCLIEFSDGSNAFGRLTPGEAGQALLAVAAYQTVRATAIPAKRWQLALGAAMEGRRACRVTGRAADDWTGPG